MFKMPEMRHGLNQFFTLRYCKIKKQRFRKNLGIFRKNWWFILFSVCTIVDPLSRGAVEDTRLEAIRTQKNPRSRSALPRKDSFEAKAKDRDASVLQKKSLYKNFSSDLQIFNNSKKYCCPRAEDGAIFEDLRPRTLKCALEDSTYAVKGGGKCLQCFILNTTLLVSSR